MAYKRYQRSEFADDAPLRTETDLEGAIVSFTYASEDGTYCVARLELEGEEKPVNVVGPMGGLHAGERVQLKGKWTRHPRFGAQFAIEAFVPVLPSTLAALEVYIGSGIAKGVRKRLAARIVKEFGEATAYVLENEPERLLDVKGMTRPKAEALSDAWETHRAVHDIMIFLQGVGITPALASRLYAKYGNSTAQILRTNPYKPALEVRQVGFRTADLMAKKLGIPHDAPQRIEAGVVHVLVEALGEGNTYLPVEDLAAAAAEMLGVEDDAARAAIDRLRHDHRIVAVALDKLRTAIYIPSMFTCESNIAEFLRALIETGKPFPKFDVAADVADYQKTAGIELAPEQSDAVRQACEGGCMVVTGGPGTGKTTLVRAIITLLERHTLRVGLCAPTGRAAQRLAETTGRPASTLHRLLKYQPEDGQFFHNQHNPLPVDMLIVDETSMVDIPLAYSLIRALPPTASVIFVGDVDQLPSVGPGNFLRDLIDSNVVPVVRLQRIFRQSQRSLIVVNAHRINQGEYPIVPKNTGDKTQLPDFFFVNQPDPEKCVEIVKTLVKDRIPERFKFDPVRDVQVLTPMRKGTLGVKNLNEHLQKLLNPSGPTLARGNELFRRGDKVMQMVNNYDLDVFNGDVGTIAAISAADHEVHVRFGGRVLTYTADMLDQIVLSYACTIHKSQGSEYKAVVVPIHTQHYILLQRNLLYTAVTRGKRLVCLVGSPKALGMAIGNAKIRERYSSLRQWLVDGPPATRDTLLPFDETDLGGMDR